MTAMGQGQGGQVGGEAAQQGQQNGEAAAQQGPDVAALAEQLGQLTQGQQELQEFLRSAPWQQQEGEQQEQAQEPPPLDVDLSFLDPADPGFEPEQVSERLTSIVGQLVEQGVQQGLQQHLQPLADQQAEMRREQAAERLVGEFPELAEEDTARQVVGLARQYAEALGQPALGAEPAFWRLVYAAGRAFDAAQQEGQEGSGDPAAATLEGGGGANPGGGQQGDAFDRMLEQKRGSSVLPFG